MAISPPDKANAAAEPARPTLRRPVALLDFIAELDGLDADSLLVLAVIEAIESGVNLDGLFDRQVTAVVEETAPDEEAAAPEMEAAKPLPVYRLGDGSRIYFGADGAPVGPPVHHLFVTNLKHKRCFGGELHGDEMVSDTYPRFKPGDILIFSPEPKVESGDYAFVKSRQRDEFIQLFFGREDIVRLRPLNPQHPERAMRRFELKVICRLVGRFERL